MRALICCSAAICCAPASADVIRFDITDLDLAIFGSQLTVDFLGPGTGEVTNTQFHLNFDTDNSSNPIDAENIFLEFSTPVETPGGIFNPEIEIIGADLGWAGRGLFEADFSTDVLNGEIFVMDEFALYFMRILNNDGGQLGGRFVDSYIDVTVVPAPMSLLAFAGIVGFSGRRRR